jgi:hypothetical protein
MIQILCAGLIFGLLATFSMDIVAIQLLRRRVFNLNGLQIVPALLGRWGLHFLSGGQLSVADIRQLPSHRLEFRFGFFLHYLIGAAFGIAFAAIVLQAQLSKAAMVFAGFGYGICTNIFPWGVMYPSMGFGVLGRKLPVQKDIVRFSFLNHLIYGATLGLLSSLFCWLHL